MKRFIFAVFFLVSITCMADPSTTLSTTGVIDSDGFTWSNATYQITFVPNPSWPSIGTYVWSGGNLQQNSIYSGSLNNSGVFSVSIPSNTSINPSGSKWNITVCPNATTGCFNVNVSATGSSQDITSILNTAAKGPRFSANPFAFGYGTVEVSPNPQPGSQFYNTTNQSCSQWTGSAQSGSWNICLNGIYLPITGGNLTGPLGVGAFIPNIVTKTTAYAVDSGTTLDYTVLCNTTSGAFTVTLPSTPATGRLLIFKLIGSTYAMTVSGNGKQIDGLSSWSTSVQNASITIQYDGTMWRIL